MLKSRYYLPTPWFEDNSLNQGYIFSIYFREEKDMMTYEMRDKILFPSQYDGINVYLAWELGDVYQNDEGWGGRVFHH